MHTAEAHAQHVATLERESERELAKGGAATLELKLQNRICSCSSVLAASDRGYMELRRIISARLTLDSLTYIQPDGFPTAAAGQELKTVLIG